MNGTWALAASAVIAALSWLYQKAWERREGRLSHYFNIVDNIPAFMAASLDPNAIDAVISRVRRLWLVGPNDVVRAANAFFESVRTAKPDAEKEEALRAFILAMRRDSTFIAAIIPRFFRNRLARDEIIFRSATRR